MIDTKKITTKIVAGLLVPAVLAGAMVAAGSSFAAGRQDRDGAGRAPRASGEARVTADAATDKPAAADEADKNAINSFLNGGIEEGKEETVYIIAGADGKTRKVIVSEWLKNPEGLERLVDMSDLIDIKNLKSDASYSIDENSMKVWDAKGEDIHYQGTSEKALPVDLKLTYMLDGRQVSAEELAGKSGRVTIRFDYQNNEKQIVSIDGTSYDMYVPFLMITGVVMDNDRFGNIEVSSGKVVNDGDKCIVMGFAMPGLQEDLGVPAEEFEVPSYVEITADVTDFSLDTTMTLASNEFVNNFDFDQAGTLGDLMAQLDTFADSAKRLADGSFGLYGSLETLLGKSKELVAGIDALYDGTQKLASGADALGTGAEQLKAGLDRLGTGLGTLSGNSQSLREGAKQVFDSLLEAADTQIDAAGLDSVPDLTADNYDAVLEGLMANMSESAVRQMASEQARQTVEQQVRANGDQVRAAVTQQVGLKVKEAVLAASGLGMDAEQYDSAVAAGQIPEDVQQQIRDAIDAQMQSDEVRGQIDELTEQQIQKLIADAMQSEAVQQQIEAAVEQAAAGSGTLGTLKNSLDSYSSFYEGVLQYTDGVDRAYAGVRELLEGAGEMSRKVPALVEGADKLNGGVGELKEKTAALVPGVTELRNGSQELSEGMDQFNEQGVKKIVDVFKGDLGTLAARLRAIEDLSRSYTNYGGKADGMDGSVKFIYKTAAINAEED